MKNETPTPRTVKVVASDMEGSGFIVALIKHAEELERELTESRSWVKASMESTAIAASTIAQLTRERDEARLLLNEDTRSVIVENDWLRKMVDSFAKCGDVGDEWLMADYRELPHVRARKAK
jgi:hypothetical protein